MAKKIYDFLGMGFFVLCVFVGAFLVINMVQTYAESRKNTCSMYHDKPFDAWWEEHQSTYAQFNITKESFVRFPFRNGLVNGIGKFESASCDQLNIGDIIVFEDLSYLGKEEKLLAHRFLGTFQKDGFLYYRELGDNLDAYADLSCGLIKGKIVPAKAQENNWAQVQECQKA